MMEAAAGSHSHLGQEKGRAQERLTPAPHPDHGLHRRQEHPRQQGGLHRASCSGGRPPQLAAAPTISGGGRAEDRASGNAPRRVLLMASWPMGGTNPFWLAGPPAPPLVQSPTRDQSMPQPQPHAPVHDQRVVSSPAQLLQLRPQLEAAGWTAPVLLCPADDVWRLCSLDTMP